VRIWLALAMSIVTNVSAASSDDAGCAGLDDAKERIQCTAASIILSPPLLSASAGADTGLWRSQTASDPITGRPVYFASLRSAHGLNRWNRPAWLTFRCKENRTEMFISWGEHLEPKVQTAYVIDTKAPVVKAWRRAPDRTAAFFPESPINFARQLDDASNLVASVTPPNAQPITAVFVVTGAGEALTGVRSACKW
jgi:hypothetical protein